MTPDPSGVNATAVTSLGSTGEVKIRSPVDVFHTRAVPSRLPVTSRVPSALNAPAMIGSV